MTVAGKGRLAVGLIGVGRLGRVYARDLAGRIAESTPTGRPIPRARVTVMIRSSIVTGTRRPNSVVTAVW